MMRALLSDGVAGHSGFMLECVQNSQLSSENLCVKPCTAERKPTPADSIFAGVGVLFVGVGPHTEENTCKIDECGFQASSHTKLLSPRAAEKAENIYSQIE